MTEEEIHKLIDRLDSHWNWAMWLGVVSGFLGGFAFGAAFAMWRQGG